MKRILFFSAIAFAFAIIVPLSIGRGWMNSVSSPKCAEAAGSGCFASLPEAVAAIGSAQTELVVPAATWNVDSSLVVPENISLNIKKGAIIDIKAGAVFSVKGKLAAGSYGIFKGEGTADLPGEINVIWFTNGGNGISGWLGANGQGGIGEAITRTTGSHVYRLSAGRYNVTKTININRPGVAIKGSEIISNSIWVNFSFASPSAVFNFDLGNSSDTLRDCSIEGIFFTANNPGGDGHSMVKAVNTSNFVARNLMTASSVNGPGIEWQGKSGLVDMVTLMSASTPIIKISKNPYASDIDTDDLTVNDAFLSCRGRSVPAIRLEDGLVFNKIRFAGRQGWMACSHGLEWNDTGSSHASEELSIENVKSEQCNDNVWLLYLKANTGLNHLSLKYFGGSDRKAGLAYLRNVKDAYIGQGNYTYPNGFMVDALGSNSITLESIFGSGSDPKINIPDMTKTESFSGGGGLEDVARFVYQKL